VRQPPLLLRRAEVVRAQGWAWQLSWR
jgi:hypothetical protein